MTTAYVRRQFPQTDSSDLNSVLPFLSKAGFSYADRRPPRAPFRGMALTNILRRSAELQ